MDPFGNDDLDCELVCSVLKLVLIALALFWILYLCIDI